MQIFSKIGIGFFAGLVPIAILFAAGIGSGNEVELEAVNGVVATNGIIVGFWAAIVAIPKRENKIIWSNKATTETAVFSSIITLIIAILLLAAASLGLLDNLFALFWSVLSFYISCWILGITLHYAIFDNSR